MKRDYSTQKVQCTNGLASVNYAAKFPARHLSAAKLQIHLYDDHTKFTVYSHIAFGKIRYEERIWSCYMHACLKQVNSDQMTNASLRDRFGLSVSNKSAISRLIAATVKKRLVKPLDPNAAQKLLCYIPFWA